MIFKHKNSDKDYDGPENHIIEGSKVREPTFEISSNPHWDSKTGKYLGNFVKKDNQITHLSANSFVSAWYKNNCPELIDSDKYCTFVANELHVCGISLLKETVFSFKDVEKSIESEKFNDAWGPFIVKLAKLKT